MMRRMVRGWQAAALGGALLSLLAAACSGGGDGGSPVTEAVTAESVLDSAAEAMASVDTVSFHLERTGAPVYLDSGGSFAFQEGDGRVSNSASAADAVVKVNALGIDANVGAVSIDGELWLSNPLTGAWEPAPDSITFDPVTLFDPETGWTPLLRDDLTGAELVDDAPDGQWHVKGQAAGTRLSAITGGLVTDDAPMDLWIDQATSQVVTAEFVTVSDEGETSWHMDLSDYGADVAITRPPGAPGAGVGGS
ncbi:MAG: LppX_LprAFG lipoprotein [Acidimicrobiales bacterium]